MDPVEHEHPSVVAALCAAVDAVLDADLGVLDDAAVHDLMVGLQRVRARLAVASAGTLREWDQRRVWLNNGSRSPAHRYARETRSAVSTGRAELARAHALDDMPHARQAVLDGTLSLDHVELFLRARANRRQDLFAEHEAALVAECAKVPYFDAVRIVRHWTLQADAVLADEHGEGEPTSPPSALHASRSLDDRLVINGELDPVDGEIVADELDRLTEQIRLADLAAGIERTPAQRRAAALVEMARRSKTAPAGGRRPQPLFTVIIGHSAFEHLCELASGAVLPTGDLVPHLTDAMLESILFDGPTTVVGVSQRRTFTGALRRAIQVRDRRCRHDSECDIPATQCDIDHIIAWTRQGETSQFNGRSFCRAHNRLPHLHGGDGTPLPHRNLTRLDLRIVRGRWNAERERTRQNAAHQQQSRQLRRPRR
jgi:hypothetical protein